MGPQAPPPREFSVKGLRKQAAVLETSRRAPSCSSPMVYEREDAGKEGEGMA